MEATRINLPNRIYIVFPTKPAANIQFALGMRRARNANNWESLSAMQQTFMEACEHQLHADWISLSIDPEDYPGMTALNLKGTDPTAENIKIAVKLLSELVGEPVTISGTSEPVPEPVSTTAIDITGLNKADVLAALFNASKPQGMGVLQAKDGPEHMICEDAEAELKRGGPYMNRLHFDYVYGRPVKTDLSGNSFEPHEYDKYNGGAGTARRVLDRIKS